MALTPLLGKAVNGQIGHLVDVLGVVATILGVSVTIGFGISQFVDGLYSITGMEWMMDMTGDAPKPATVGLISALVMIMAMSIISAVSGVGKGGKYLSNLNLVRSLILLLVFVFYCPLSADAYAANLPAKAAPLAGDLFAGTTNAWGSLEGFQSGLTGAAAQLPAEVQVAAYEAGSEGRLFGGNLAGPRSTGLGGSRSRLLWVYFWRVFPKAGLCENLSLAA